MSDSQAAEMPPRSRRDLLTKPFAALKQAFSSTETQPPPPLDPREIPRRSIVQALGIMGVSAAVLSGDTSPGQQLRQMLGNIFNFDLGSDYKMGQDMNYGIPEEKIPFSQRQLCIESNPKFQEGLGKHDSAVIIVHPGYVDYTIAAIQQWYHSAQQVQENKDLIQYWQSVVAKNLGDYYVFRKNLIDLVSNLKKTTTPVIFYIEDKDSSNPTTPLPELKPPDNALVMITGNSSYKPLKTINLGLGNDIRYNDQRPDMLFKALKDAGVTRILAAGETSFNDIPEPACLGGVVQQFLAQGFQVQGIQEVVFPTLRPAVIKSGEEVRQGLYDNAIPLKTVLSSLD